MFVLIVVEPLALILNGDYFLGSVLATTLTKLILRYSELEQDATLVNSRRAEVIVSYLVGR
jgi:coatomer subunit beta